MAPTGVAAVNIGGQTTFAAVGCKPHYRKSKNWPSEEIRKFWRPVDCVIIDEMSFLDLASLQRISERLRDILGSTSSPHALPFGGLSVVLSGDFAQLPPPKGRSLTKAIEFARLEVPQRLSEGQEVGHSKKKKKNASDLNYDDTIYGAILYLDFELVVIIRKIFRQEDGSPFTLVLDNLRDASLAEADIAWINRRHISKLSDDELMPLRTIDDLPLMVAASNEARHALNNAMLQQAARQGKKIIKVKAKIDPKDKNVKLTDAHLKRFFDAGDEETNRYPSVFYMHLGMRVMVTKNIAPSQGIANGTLGTIVGWQFPEDAHMERAPDPILGGLEILHAHSRPEFVLLMIDNPKFSPFPSLTAHHNGDSIFPIFTKKNDLVEVPSHGGPNASKIQLYIEQVPLVPSYAVTIHKSQGISVKNLIVATWIMGGTNNLASLQMAYVALSRLRSIDGLYLFEPMPLRYLQFKGKKDIKDETIRLEKLAQITADKMKEDPLHRTLLKK